MVENKYLCLFDDGCYLACLVCLKDPSGDFACVGVVDGVKVLKVAVVDAEGDVGIGLDGGH